MAVNLFEFGQEWRFAFAKNSDLPRTTFSRYTPEQRKFLLATLMVITWPLDQPYRPEPFRDRGLNNRMERLNQTFRDRNKTQRGLDHKKSAQEMADGIRLAYNFTRPHMALKGRTPAEAAGLDLRLGQNRWKALIHQSARAAETEHTKND